MKSLKRRREVRKGFARKRRSGTGKGNLLPIIREEKSFEGKSSRALGAERGSRGSESLKPARG
jgi:hypothetical protein